MAINKIISFFFFDSLYAWDQTTLLAFISMLLNELNWCNYHNFDSSPLPEALYEGFPTSENIYLSCST